MPTELETSKIETFEQAESVLMQLTGNVQNYRRDFENLRDRAERTVRDIKAAGQRADNELARYRSLLHDGEKAESDIAIEAVSKARKEAKDFARQLQELLPEIGPVKKGAEAVRLQALSFIETQFLIQIERRLKAAFGCVGQITDSCDHTDVELDKLSEYIRKHSL